MGMLTDDKYFNQKNKIMTMNSKRLGKYIL